MPFLADPQVSSIAPAEKPVKIEWTPAAQASARRYMNDQVGMRAIGSAVAELADRPYPADAFHRGDYHRLRAASYRLLCFVDGDLITMAHVDRLTLTRVAGCELGHSN